MTPEMRKKVFEFAKKLQAAKDDEELINLTNGFIEGIDQYATERSENEKR